MSRTRVVLFPQVKYSVRSRRGESPLLLPPKDPPDDSGARGSRQKSTGSSTKLTVLLVSVAGELAPDRVGRLRWKLKTKPERTSDQQQNRGGVGEALQLVVGGSFRGGGRHASSDYAMAFGRSRPPLGSTVLQAPLLL